MGLFTSHAQEHRPEEEPPTLANVWSDGLGRAGSRAGQILLIGALAWFAIQGLIRLNVILIAVVVATILACALRPVVRWMKDEGLNNTLAAVATFLGSIAVLSGIIWLVVESVLNQMADTVCQSVEMLEKLVKARDLDLASKIIDGDDQIDDLHLQVRRLVRDPEVEMSREQIVNATLLSRFLERLGDHTSKAAGRVLYIVRGDSITHHNEGCAQVEVVSS